jgi:predicted CopG family antitoxin
MRTQATIKISSFTHQVLKRAKSFTGESITDIVNRLVEREYPKQYKNKDK